MQNFPGSWDTLKFLSTSAILRVSISYLVAKTNLEVMYETKRMQVEGHVQLKPDRETFFGRILSDFSNRQGP